MTTDKILKYFATLVLIIFCIQYIPLESRAGVSPIKLAVSVFCPFFIVIYSPKLGKAASLFLLYYTLVIFAAVTHPDTLRWSTVLYLATFIVTYLAFYNLVVFEKVFSPDYFIKLLEVLIAAYTIILLIQQFFILIGIVQFPFINLVQVFNKGIRANSLSYEPSTAAMILSFAYLSLLRILEIKYGKKLKIKELFIQEKWTSISFFWSMLTMGSGTAFVGLAIITLYFIKFDGRNGLYATAILVVAIIAFTQIDYEPLNRARDSFVAFLSLDRKISIETDASAAYRTIWWTNTFTELDLTTWQGWFGHGVDYGDVGDEFFNDRIMVGNIADYGFLSFILLQIMVYSCMIRKFFSLETLMWLILILATLNNEPFRWGCMMLFTVVRYFQVNSTLNSQPDNP